MQFRHGRFLTEPPRTDRRSYRDDQENRGGRQFSQQLKDEIVSRYLFEPSRFGVINAFTNNGPNARPPSTDRDGAVCRDAFGGNFLAAAWDAFEYDNIGNVK